MKSLLALKCPSCKGNLSVEEGRVFTFCQFCGTKILLNDENRYTYRHINDADIKRAETEQIVKLKELEQKDTSGRNKKTFILVWVLLSVVFIFGGAIIFISDPSYDFRPIGALIILFGMLFCLIGFIILPFVIRGNKR